MACGGDLGWQVVTTPGQLREQLAQAGPHGPVHVCYQPRGGDVVEHWEHCGWLCIHAQNLILVADEVDMICSAGAPMKAGSKYWKRFGKMPALDHIVNYGRHSHIAFVGIARAPQDVWVRLRGQAGRVIVFRMSAGSLELEAVRQRLGSVADQLTGMREYTYLDWHDDGSVTTGGGKL